MVAMTGYAVIFDQLLMKGYILLFFIYGKTFGGYYPNLVYLMAGNTLTRPAAKKGCMAGKAVTGDFGVGVYRFSWADHALRGVDGQQD